MINVKAHNLRTELQLLRHFIDGDGVEFEGVDLLIYSMLGNLNDSLWTADGVVEWDGKTIVIS